MKGHHDFRRGFAAVLLLGSLATGWCATTISATHRYAYGANLGWINWVADTNHGAVIGNYVCSGYLYAANVGWINLGSGTPADGIRYQNNSVKDFGVNNDGFGDLRGYAWGANIGWIHFEDTGAPKVDLRTGQLSGYVWSANCGWISLSNATAQVQTDTLSPGRLDSNGLPVAWELTYFQMTGVNPNADPDHDGMSNYQEYLAGTNPTNGADYFHVISEDVSAGGTKAILTWTSTLARLYSIQTTLNLAAPNWLDSGLGIISPDGAVTARTLPQTNSSMRFYRIRAVIPLSSN